MAIIITILKIIGGAAAWFLGLMIWAEARESRRDDNYKDYNP